MPTGFARPNGELALADRWILSRLDQSTPTSIDLLAANLYGEAGRQMREFVWSEVCDWYIEAAKVRLRADEREKQEVAQTLAFLLERTMRTTPSLYTVRDRSHVASVAAYRGRA